ncbi:zf-HC2 domain-containing protein [Streptomyces goshikiensis]|uniref:zf-HC2 domain-containing protein n=1 Tax=Streptomyces goshikiensis TaxID=1942 RepID=UPI0036673BC9
MSGASPTPAEQHLGDRLAALVDGELSHDARERVLAHLATCAKCKAEADAQRRLKTLFVESAPPPLSAGLLARLQGLPGGDLDGSAGLPGPVGSAGSALSHGPPGASGPGSPARSDPFATFGYAAAAMPREGFRIHEVGRSRRRFAFVAAGAVSLAALALGGTLPIETVEPQVRGDVPATRPGPAVSVTDAVILDRLPTPSVALPGLRPGGPQPPVRPSQTPSARPVSLSR